jgi:hypothetical protein
MRAGPLSNTNVISLLNRHFVPVYVVNEDYAIDGPAPAEEKAERDRIFREGHAANLSVGTVHVYLLSPEGRLLDSMHVAHAARTTNLIAGLEKTIAALKVQGGESVVPLAPQSRPPSCEPNSLVLHLTARSLDGRGAWSDFPVEDWIVLSREEQRQFIDAGRATVGQTWTIPPELSRKLLTHFYPPTENNDVSKNRFEQQSLAATVVSVKDGVVRAAIEGRLKMQHNFYYKDDGRMVEATVAGFMDFEPGERLVAMRLVTDQATYNGGKFGVAVRSVP